jgi:hypothetical protein
MAAKMSHYVGISVLCYADATGFFVFLTAAHFSVPCCFESSVFAVIHSYRPFA